MFNRGFEQSVESYVPGYSSADPNDRERAELTSLLSPVPVPVDELIRQCRLSAPLVAVILLELELAGRLERHAGGRVSLVLSAKPCDALCSSCAKAIPAAHNDGREAKAEARRSSMQS